MQHRFLDLLHVAAAAAGHARHVVRKDVRAPVLVVDLQQEALDALHHGAEEGGHRLRSDGVNGPQGGPQSVLGGLGREVGDGERQLGVQLLKKGV